MSVERNKVTLFLLQGIYYISSYQQQIVMRGHPATKALLQDLHCPFLSVVIQKIKAQH